jgi:hypothetical protein
MYLTDKPKILQSQLDDGYICGNVVELKVLIAVVRTISGR